MTRGGIGDEIYALLINLEPRQRRTALEYAHQRMLEDSRAQEAAKHAGPKPTFWCLDGKLPGDDFTGPDLGELLAEFMGRDFEITEAAGMAVVDQRFLVWLPVDGSWEPESFATRAEAEACAAQWKAESANPLPRRPEGMADDERAAFLAWWKMVAAKGAWVDEAATDNLDSASWVMRFRAKMTPDQAFTDCDLIPF
jgi:hypothetical protein